MSDIYKQIAKIGEAITDEIRAKVYGIARAKVQNDFNNEIVSFVAGYTGHPTLSQTVFVDVKLDSIDLQTNHYTDPSFIAGKFSSHSKFHPGYEGWSPVSMFNGMSRGQFWKLKLSGQLKGDNNGGVDSEWLTDNFWAGIVIGTNGWPRGSAEFLSIVPSSHPSGEDAVDQYVKNYIKSDRYPQYILAALSNFI